MAEVVALKLLIDEASLGALRLKYQKEQLLFLRDLYGKSLQNSRMVLKCDDKIEELSKEISTYYETTTLRIRQ